MPTPDPLILAVRGDEDVPAAIFRVPREAVDSFVKKVFEVAKKEGREPRDLACNMIRHLLDDGERDNLLLIPPALALLHEAPNRPHGPALVVVGQDKFWVRPLDFDQGMQAMRPTVH